LVTYVKYHLKKKPLVPLDGKGVFTPFYHPKLCFAGGSTLLLAGCCDVHEPVLSATLDNYLFSFIIPLEAVAIQQLLSNFSINFKLSLAFDNFFKDSISMI
jgi:hypothetical protein